MAHEERNETGFEAKGMDELLSNATTVTGSFATGHAVVIGVANYRNVCPLLPEAVLNDARDVAAVLTSSACCGYEPHNVHLLLDGDATLARIRTALASVAETSGPDDTVVIFFSGHGALLGDPVDPESALLPVEFDGRTTETTSLSETEFSSALRRISAQRLLVLIDACHSGGAGSFKNRRQEASPTFGYSEKSLGRLAQGTGRVLIASSRASEASIVFPNARNSVFTTHLLDALRGRARTSGDGAIRVFEIFNHVSQMVKREVPGCQHPIFKASDLEDNFPVALDRGGAKSDAPAEASTAVPEAWSQLRDIMPELYPAGPMDQEFWVRAGGDPSRIRLNETGRAAWFAALRVLRLGGGGAGIGRKSLIETALEDYPHHPELAALL
ncbi:MAG: caspase family protein [Chromatiales bacterium]|nr:caspase family protein [Chromatiales bacterium]